MKLLPPAPSDCTCPESPACGCYACQQTRSHRETYGTVSAQPVCPAIPLCAEWGGILYPRGFGPKWHRHVGGGGINEAQTTRPREVDSREALNRSVLVPQAVCHAPTTGGK